MNLINRTGRYIYRIVILVVAILTLCYLFNSSSASAVPETPHTVINVTTEVDEFGEGSQCSLREAIQTANDGSDFGGCELGGSGALAINIPADTYSLTRQGIDEDSNVTGDLDIKVQVGLYGDSSGSTIIQGDGSTNRVFHIVQDDAIDYVVTMWDLSITNGYSESYGGGVLNEESLWISRVSIFGNEADLGGAGVSSMPAHDSQGFHVYLSSTVLGNNAYFGLGGGILVDNGDIRLDHVEIADNIAAGGGGLFLGGDTAEINWSNIHANTAVHSGGGITLGDGNLYLEDSGVYANIAGDEDGGNLYLWTSVDGATSIARCYIGEGQAVYGVGAGIYNVSELSLLSSTVTLNAGDHAAGIYHAPTEGSGVMLTIRDSTVAYNNRSAEAGNDGEGLYNYQNLTDIQIQNTIITDNGHAGSGDDNCFSGGDPARLVSLGHNLDSGDSCGFSLASDLTGIDPLLGDLDFHEGFSLNYELEPMSPALETGGDCLATDQRGFTRPMDQNRDDVALCDIGASEAEPYFLPPLAWFPLVVKP